MKQQDTSKSAEFVTRVALLRAEIKSVRGEIEWTQQSLIPKSELIERLDAYLARRAQRLDTTNLGAFAHPESGNTDLFTLSSYSIGAPIKMDLAPLLAWLFPDLLRERLRVAVEQLDYEAGPPTVERPALLARLAQRLRALEIEEERLIVEAAAAHVEIVRRPDVDAAIVLELVDDALAPERNGTRGVQAPGSAGAAAATAGPVWDAIGRVAGSIMRNAGR